MFVKSKQWHPQEGNMDRFDAMQAFARVVETGSFTRAAQTLHIRQAGQVRVSFVPRHRGAYPIAASDEQIQLLDGPGLAVLGQIEAGAQNLAVLVVLGVLQIKRRRGLAQIQRPDIVFGEGA